MNEWSDLVKNYPLNLEKIFRKYTRLPLNTSDVFYHYTTHVGIEGILKSGGLRATYRLKMNDEGEFAYAKKIIDTALNNFGEQTNLPNFAYRLIQYVQKNIDKLLVRSIEMSMAYCSCLTLCHDDLEQWKTYAENGKGFAIGFNLLEILKQRKHNVNIGKPFIFFSPVIYSEQNQNEFVWDLLETGINDLQNFANDYSQQPRELTSLRDRITQEIVIYLLTLIDFLKAPIYSKERELRLFLDPNNDNKLKVTKIEYYKNGSEMIPFIFIDFRDPRTMQIPITEIKIGSYSSFQNEKSFVENLLSKYGYKKDIGHRPNIVQSIL